MGLDFFILCPSLILVNEFQMHRQQIQLLQHSLWRACPSALVRPHPLRNPAGTTDQCATRITGTMRTYCSKISISFVGFLNILDIKQTYENISIYVFSDVLIAFRLFRLSFYLMINEDLENSVNFISKTKLSQYTEERYNLFIEPNRYPVVLPWVW